MRRPSAMPALSAAPTQVETFGEELLTASAIFDDVGTFAAGLGTLSGLSGAAETAYHEIRTVLGGCVDACSLAMRGAAVAVLDHAAELERLSTARGELLSRYGELVALGESCEGEVALDAALETALEAAIDAYEGDRARWIRELTATETEVLAALRQVMTLEQAQRRYGGRPDPADGVLPTMPAPGSPPDELRRWWDGLTPAQQLALIAADPELVGNRDGLPAAARDRANMICLRRDQQELGQLPPERLTAQQRARLANAGAAQAALDRMASAYDPLTGGHYPTQLYSYDPDAFGGDGVVAIALGDLDTADNIAITVPGLGTDATSAPVQSTKAINLRQASDFLGHGLRNATMFWIGYDAPDNVPWVDGGLDAAGVLTQHMARAGGHRLATTIDGMQQMRQRDAHVTVIGHSYGSTVASLGASYSRPDEVDDLVLVGSPGAGTGIDHAADTGVAPGHVWAGRDSGDPITRLADHGSFHFPSGVGMGVDPASDDFGAHRFQAESGTRGGALAHHKSYFDHDSESLANMARIVNGDVRQVVAAQPVHDPLLPAPQRHLGSIARHAGHLLGDVADGVRHPSHAWSDVTDGALQGVGLLDDIGGGPVDPEAERTPTRPDTHGW